MIFVNCRLYFVCPINDGLLSLVFSKTKFHNHYSGLTMTEIFKSLSYIYSITGKVEIKLGTDFSCATGKLTNNCTIRLSMHSQFRFIDATTNYHPILLYIEAWHLPHELAAFFLYREIDARETRLELPYYDLILECIRTFFRNIIRSIMYITI